MEAREARLETKCQAIFNLSLLFAQAGLDAAALAKLSPDEAALMSCFAGGAMPTLDALVTQTNKPISTISATLMMLELKRLIAKRADVSFEARG